MSLPAIIAGLLAWRSLPPLLSRGLSRRGRTAAALACKCAGLLLIAGGIAAGFFS